LDVPRDDSEQGGRAGHSDLEGYQIVGIDITSVVDI
jgi:hypothetical protein